MKRWQKIGILLMIIVGIGWWMKINKSQIQTSQEIKPVGAIVEDDWVVGNPQAAVQIVEYSDFQCPACKFYSGVAEEIEKTFGDRVGFAYRFFPLKSIHKNATLAAQAAHAAGMQGKFWEMHTLLFDNQEEWENSNQALIYFASYAEKLGLNMDQFRRDIDSSQVKKVVENSYLAALVAKIDATPTFYINGQKVNNLRGPEDLIKRIEFALEEASAAASPSGQQ